jgi:hypothetical protein
VSRYILRSITPGRVAEAAREADEAVRRLGGEVIDAAAGMLLFDASPRAASAIARQLPDWRVSPETLARTAGPAA